MHALRVALGDLQTLRTQPDSKMATPEQESLAQVIQQWNSNRLDLFALSQPNENLEFHGVMRFYFQDAGQKVATKCIRVSSTATTQAVIETLIEKFRPDMRMLEVPEFALYEIHENGVEKRLEAEQRPLMVQLNWHKDDLEGRFLLRRRNEVSVQPSFEESSFKRKPSGKKSKKRDQHQQQQNKDQNANVAEKLYTELPETSFTRSISNPEAVMRRRRQQKLERKLQQFRSKDGGPDTGGTLKIYGESLCKDVPYKTLLLSVSDTAQVVVKEMLSKYGLTQEDPNNYCLTQVFKRNEDVKENNNHPPSNVEYILDDDDCPLAILMNCPPSQGSIMFHIRRRPADMQPRKRKKKLYQTANSHAKEQQPDESAPFLLELRHDGAFSQRHALLYDVTEAGSEQGLGMQVFGADVQPRHCVFASSGGLVTVTPCSREAETYVNEQRIWETTILQHGCTVRLGRHHLFRFVDPATASVRRDSPEKTFETTFDVTGHVETTEAPQRCDPILPAVLEFREETRDALLETLIGSLDTSSVHFKLAPTYALYLATRYRASTHYRPDLTPTERAQRLSVLLEQVASQIQQVVVERPTEAESLTFWMANASELLHFLKADRHISAFTLDAQDILAETVHSAFNNMVAIVEHELAASMPSFWLDSDDNENAAAAIIVTLMSAMALMRRCRVNAALTIQLFSQLFHLLNMWIFNRLVCGPDNRFCCRRWGGRIQLRLSHVEQWAEKQGLELAADCHLSRVLQAAYLLQAPKYTADQLATLSSTCFKLNSLQLAALLKRYWRAPNEPEVPPELVENVVRVAESVADELIRADGREVRLDEQPELQLPFLLPEDGYSCDVVRGMPVGLLELLGGLQQAGLCRFTIQPTSSGLWTIYMEQQQGTIPRPSSQPERAVVQLNKAATGLGLSIVAAKGAGQDKLGIYVKTVVRGGAADIDGRLRAGDQLLKVDGQSLVGITQEKAAEYLVKTGPVVTLEIAKQGAICHGLATLLSQPSPDMGRNSWHHPEPNEARRPMQSSKSVPALNNSDKAGPPVATHKAIPTSVSFSHDAIATNHRSNSSNSILDSLRQNWQREEARPPETIHRPEMSHRQDLPQRTEMMRHPPEMSRSQEMMRHHEMNRQSELMRTQDISRSSDMIRAHEIARSTEMAMARPSDLSKSQEMPRPMELIRLQESMRQSEMSRSQEMTKPLDRSHEVSRSLDRSQDMSRQLERNQEINRQLERSHEVSRQLERSQEINRQLERSQEITRQLERSHEMSRSMDRSHEMSRAMDRSQEMPRQPEMMRQQEMMRHNEMMRADMIRGPEIPQGPPMAEVMTRSVTFVDEPKSRRHDEVPRRAVSFSMDQPEPSRKDSPTTPTLPPPLPSTSPPRDTPVPLPPERNSSYVVMAQQGHDYKEESPHRSSYYDTDSSDMYPNEDPNSFINEAEMLLMHHPSSADNSGVGNTPGVIGAQEVYKDPRNKRLAEQQQQKQMASRTGPEKLSFKEKMKMFAMETGEFGPLKNKVSNSRAQRDIESPQVP
ncbi:afadin isoform X2 [Neocloeon triangulifer]|uniref:afadin isoform X2 n=1 Tax=Neocloeon triangulifer TaxID=2078957 RepID=UPI00286F253A|nr:afadin isoform X2 [Neocloeon triangulifer]